MIGNEHPPEQTFKRASYAELARLFLRMSVTAFGGPVAHIAMAEDEIVTRRGWITREHFLDLVAAVNLIPGPNSTEVMIHVGYLMRGIPGAILAGACFIVPSFLLTLALTMAYVAGASLEVVSAIFWGLKPVIVAIIAAAGVRLMPSALKSRSLQVLFVIAIVLLIAFDLSEVVVMLGGGVIYALFRMVGRRIYPPPALMLIATGHGFSHLANLMGERVAQTAAALSVLPTLGDLFWYFLRIGSILFGSGYVLFAYVQQDLVGNYGWLTAQQLLDAIAIGQFTPGPVFTSAGSMGYMIAGIPGAIVSAVAIFLPAFVFVILSAPYIPRLRASRFFSAFLDGVNAGVLAAIVLVVVELARAALVPLPDALEAGLPLSVVATLLAAAAFIGLTRYWINATWLLLVGGVVGLLLHVI